MKELEREVLLSFWKVHILHHAETQPVFGQWVIRELRRHGYEVSPGTLYPLLNRMEERGWLELAVDPEGGPRARKDYSLTDEGKKVLELLRGQVEELYREVVLGHELEVRDSSVGDGAPNERARRSPMEFVVVAIAALLASGLTMFSGFGLGTLLLPIFALFLPVELAATASYCELLVSSTSG